MGQIILHASDFFIEEDREYYFSGERDKHNQILPSEGVYSTTPCSDHLDYQPGDGKVGNFFFPTLPNQIDRIYIGISVPLFANSWGASFLLELLKWIKPGGTIVLPVYPEGQAGEIGYWSRSFLENIFLSRSRWRQMNNIFAENDGVMSMREGRKLPAPIPSTIEWFYNQRSTLLLQSVLHKNENSPLYSDIQETFVSMCRLVWNEYRSCAVVERIITDCFSARHSLSVAQVGCDYGLLVNDLLLSHYVSVTSGVTCHLGACNHKLLANVESYFAPLNGYRHELLQVTPEKIQIDNPHDMICVTDVFTLLGRDHYQSLLQSLWDRLKPNGVLVIGETFAADEDGALADVEQACAVFGPLRYYSMQVASARIQDVSINHYSPAVQEQLQNELIDHKHVYRVLIKS